MFIFNVCVHSTVYAINLMFNSERVAAFMFGKPRRGCSRQGKSPLETDLFCPWTPTHVIKLSINISSAPKQGPQRQHIREAATLPGVRCGFNWFRGMEKFFSIHFAVRPMPQNARQRIWKSWALASAGACTKYVPPAVVSRDMAFPPAATGSVSGTVPARELLGCFPGANAQYNFPVHDCEPAQQAHNRHMSQVLLWFCWCSQC